MNITGSLKEIVSSSYYRTNPAGAIRLAYAKWLFGRTRVTDPLEILHSLGISSSDAFDGFGTWQRTLESVVSQVKSKPGHQGGASLEDGMILYGIVRALRPNIIIETGVAAGVSTSFILAALIENGSGSLISIDLPPEVSATLDHPDGARFDWPKSGVGWAIPEEIKRNIGGRHSLVLEDVRQALPRVLSEQQSIDVFVHDDLHTPDHMLWQYELVWPLLSKGGCLVSDDVNYGWINFVNRHQLGGAALLNIQRLSAVRKRG